MIKIFTTTVFAVLIPVFVFAQLNRSESRQEILVQLEKGVGVSAFLNKIESGSRQSSGLKIKKNLAPEFGYYLLSYENEFAGEPIIELLQQQPEVISTQFNLPVQFRDSIPNDPLFAKQWDMERIGLPPVWNVSTGGTTSLGDEIVIAVLDKGFDIGHEDLAGNVWINKGEIPGDGIDNDQNGFVDDINGWNFRFDSAVIFPENHGTWVSGILGARGNNGKGLAGTNWNVKIMFLAIEYADEVVSAFNYVIKQRELYNATNGQKGAYIVVTNGSFGIDKVKCSAQPAWGDLYDPMGQTGILSVAATANENWDVDDVGDIPTSCSSPYLISVTSTDKDDQKVTNAAFGKINIDLGAPGQTTTTINTINRYKEDFGGTSSACPHVAGAIALLYSLPCTDIALLSKTLPDSAARLMRDAIYKGVDPLSTLKDKTVTGGRLNVAKAMEYLHSYCIAKTGERASGNFKDIWFSEKDLIRIYPNPVSDKLFIDYSNDSFSSISVQIFNALGQEVRFPESATTLPFQGQRIEIDLKDWPSGTYFISLPGTDRKITLKFVKI